MVKPVKPMSTLKTLRYRPPRSFLLYIANKNLVSDKGKCIYNILFYVFVKHFVTSPVFLEGDI